MLGSLLANYTAPIEAQHPHLISVEELACRDDSRRREKKGRRIRTVCWGKHPTNLTARTGDTPAGSNRKKKGKRNADFKTS